MEASLSYGKASKTKVVASFAFRSGKDISLSHVLEAKDDLPGKMIYDTGVNIFRGKSSKTLLKNNSACLPVGRLFKAFDNKAIWQKQPLEFTAVL